MLAFLIAIGVVTLIFGLVPLWMTRRFGDYVEDRLGKPIPAYSPKVSVIIPCKGTDLEFEQNILAFLSQDYLAYEVLFVTATEDDPARPALERIVASRKAGPPVRLLTAGIHPSRGQKITNLLAGLSAVAPDTEVLVFWDADIRVRPDFLTYLVAPLADPAVGATTGFPWYLPATGRPGSVLRSIWGAGALPMLVDPRRNFTSGACNALKKTVFERGNVAQAMDRTISDTFAITNSVRRLGLKIEFVPQCLATTPDDFTFLETLKWTNRQTIISRVYSPPFWWMVALSYSFSNAVLLLGMALLVAGAVTGHLILGVPAALMLALIPLEIINATRLLPVIQKLLPDHADQIEKLKWKYYLLTPLASVLIMTNSLVSRTTNEIEWRGVRYRLVSADRTEVLFSDNA